mgnify:CR=1 FL=1|jgi:hypothetical protein
MFKLLILLGSFSFGMSAAIMETNPAWAEEDIEFFVGARSTANNEWQWTSKLEVPLIPDLAAYGYAANVPPNEDITVTDILSLPARIAVVPTNARVSKDGRTVTITKTRRSSSEGRLGSMYIIAPGDPAGSYSLSVLFNGEPVKTFHFQVIYAGTAAPETDVKKLIADLVEKKRQAEGYWQACFDTPYSTPAEYTLLSYRQAFTQADRLIARHHQYAENWKMCLQGTQAKIGIAHKALSNLMATLPRGNDPSDPETKALVEIFSRTLSRLSKNTESIGNSVIRLHVEQGNYFQSLRTARHGQSNELIQLPNTVQQLEQRIVGTIRASVDSLVEDLEEAYKLVPSVKLGARRDNARIMQSVTRAVSVFYEKDARNDLQRLGESLKEFEFAMFRTYQLLKNESLIATVPEFDGHYRAIATDLKEIRDIFEAFIEIEKLTPAQTSELTDKPEFQELLAKSVQQLEQAGTRLDQRFIVVDNLLSR